MIGYQELTQIILYAVKALTQIYTPLLNLIWNFAIKYGLQGNMAYLGFAMGNRSYLELYSCLYGNIFPAMISLVLGLSSLIPFAIFQFLILYILKEGFLIHFPLLRCFP